MASMPTQTGRKIPYPDQIHPGKIESSDLPSVENRNRELFRIRASRLVDLFPDELVIQEKTISVIRNYLLTSFIETIPVRDIGRVVYVNVPFFAGIEILGKNPMHNLQVKGLPKKRAWVAKDILEGLLMEKAGELEVPEWMHIDTRREALERGGHASRR